MTTMIRKFVSARSFLLMQRNISKANYSYNSSIPVVNYDPESKNNKLPNELQARKSSAEIFEIINNEPNPNNIINCIYANKNDIEPRHITATLVSLTKLYKAQSLDPSLIQGEESFKLIIKLLNSNLRELELSQISIALSTLTIMGVKSSTVIMQSLLQLLRVSINDLLLEQIYSLTFVLRKMKPTHLSEAILEALPKVFIIQLEDQLDKTDIKELAFALRYATLEIKDEKAINFITQAIHEYNDVIDTKSAVSILRSISNIKDLKTHHIKILCKLSQIIQHDINVITGQLATKMIDVICTKIDEGQEELYDGWLIDKFIERTISGEAKEPHFKFRGCVFILNKIIKIKHINLQILNFLIDYIKKDPSIIQNSSPITIKTIITGLAFANYKPSNWDKLKDLLTHKEHIDKFNLADLTYFTFHLACLDYYDNNLIKKVFTEKHIIEFLSIRIKWTFQRLYQSVKTLHPEYSGPWPSNDLLDTILSVQVTEEAKDYPLLPALEHIFGKSHVVTNVLTELNHIIDHIIVLKDESPVEVEYKKSNDFVKFEDIKIPDDAKAYLILFIEKYKCGRNTDIILGPHMLHMKSLQTMGHNVICISEHVWNALEDYEKLPYLKRAAGLKTKN